MMTNSEAIKELKLMRYNDANTGDMDRALAMAIEALSNSQNQTNSLIRTSTDSVSEADVIYRQNAIDALMEILDRPNHAEFLYTDEICRALNHLPSAQRTGEWEITDAYPHNVYCSECHKKFAQTHWAVWENGSLPRNYCPNCGADMRGDNNV